MLLALKQLDTAVFLLINNLPHPEIADFVFLFFSFYPLLIWIVIGIVLIIVEERKEKLFIIRLSLALIVAGALASGLIKPLVRRPRPDISHGKQVVLVEEKPAVLPWNNDFAFPSGHAAVAFAGAYIVAREETVSQHSKKHSKSKQRLMQWIFYTFALLTAFSRIYLGKHYPLDVIVGAVLGLGVGWVSWRVVDNLKRTYV